MTTPPPPSVDTLWALLQQQRKDHAAERQALREQIARLEARIDEQEKTLGAQRVVSPRHGGQSRDVRRADAPSQRRFSRSRLITAATAGVIGLAGIETLRPQIALANSTDGDLQVGVVNVTGQNGLLNNGTTLNAGTGMTGDYVLGVSANTGGNTRNITAIQGTGGGSFSGVSGFGGPSNGSGVYGQAGGSAGTGVVGVFGTPNYPSSGAAAGVLGSSAGTGSGPGVMGIGTGQSVDAVVGNSNLTPRGIGVYGIGASIFDVGGAAGVFGTTVDGNGTGVHGETTGPYSSGVYGVNTNAHGTGVWAIGGGFGVMATSGQVAVFASIDGEGSPGTGPYGVFASCPAGVGVYAESSQGYGVHAVGFPGFFAEGATQNGLNGRGGKFGSQQAQIRLLPGRTAGPPTNGQQLVGDFWVDSAGSLYYYNGTSWKQLA